MLAGAAAGAGILEWSPAAVIGIAAALVAAVAFMTAIPGTAWAARSTSPSQDRGALLARAPAGLRVTRPIPYHSVDHRPERT
jgi:hypothetical protein